MKKFTNRIVMTFALVLGLSLVASSQIEVTVRPNAPAMRARPVAPSPRHVWVDGEWAYRGNNYVWNEGYWVEPRPGMMWVPGRWRRSHHGWIWVAGSWRHR